ncbi:MAG: nucleoside hydrolase [Alphaproteobacteria bacterium]|nr:nucleoside hydrolase [Alphaproteobacteria bacterium]
MVVAAPLRPFVIDCDTGRDDALALALALQSAEPLAGVIATYGNVPQDKVYANCADVLGFFGADGVPLFAGCGQPSNPAAVAAMLRARQSAAGNGLCNLTLAQSARRTLPASGENALALLAEDLEKMAALHGALDYVILGPATTAAALLRHWGAKAENIIARLTMMGGKLDALWQSAPVADFNLACDPFAVAQLLALEIPLRFVPLNVTWPVVLTVLELEALQPQHARAEFFKDLMLAHALRFGPEPVFRFHDPTVILALAAPDEFLPASLTIGCASGSDFARLMPTPTGRPAFVMRTTAAQPVSLLAELLSRLGLAQPA